MNPAKERLIIEYLLSNTEAFALCKSIIEPNFFSLENRGMVDYVLKYANTYSAAPSFDIVNAEFGSGLEPKNDGSIKLNWILDETEKFCRLEKVIQAVEQATELISEGKVDLIVQPIKDAVLLGLNRDLGLDYFKNPKQRLLDMMANSAKPTGFADLDFALFGGIEIGGVNIVAANSGGGKSFFLANLALNWVERGDNVLYISLELSQNLVAKRFDAMVSKIESKEIFHNIDTVDYMVKVSGKNSGCLQIKFFPPQTKISQIEAYILDYMIKTGVKPDLLIVDYLDLLMPNHSKVDINDQFIKDKFVAEDLRALQHEYGLYGFTASQLNRSGVDQKEHNQANIAGGISKINTSDITMTILQDVKAREHGRFILQLLKTRNSSGEGKKITLAIDNLTMRLGDLTDDTRKLITNGRAIGSNNSNISSPALARLRRAQANNSRVTP